MANNAVAQSAVHYPPCIGFIAPSGTGKTTLLRQLIPLLNQHGLRIGYLKHAHHVFDIDQPGKDSYVIRAAGAAQVIIASEQRWVLLHEGGEADLLPLLARFDPTEFDLVLIEGFHRAHYPKIAVQRTQHSQSITADHAHYYTDPDLIALVSDALTTDYPLPLLALNQPATLAEFILTHWTAGRLVIHPTAV